MTELEEKYYLASTTDTKGIITSVSKAFCQISGYTKEELIGRSHNIVRHPDTKSEVFSNMWSTIQKGQIWKGEVKNLTKSKDYYWVDSTVEPIFNESKEIVGYASIRFDITDKKKLQQQQELNLKVIHDFELLVKTASVGIAFLDNNGYFTQVNPYTLNLLGYSQSELLEKRCSDLTTNEFADANTTMFQEIKKSPESKKIIKQCIKKDGSLIWTETVYKVFDKNRILVVLKNIESYKRLEENNKLMLAQSKQAGMGELLSMVAHQWRQPLTTIITILSKMKIKYTLGNLSQSDFESDFAKTKSTVYHLSKTIDTFYDYFKEKKGEEVSILTLIESVNAIMEPILKANEITTLLECADNALLVDDRVDQVILNIFQNANDILVQNNKQSMKIIKVNIFVDDKNMLVIRICDNAGGIPTQIQEKIFEPYFSTKSKNGSGLGLYMSRNIIENYIGGKINTYNTDNGACFEILIPQDKN